MDIWTRSRKVPTTSADVIWDKAHQNEMLDEYMRLGAGGEPKSETIEMYREDYDLIMDFAKYKGITFTQVLENYILPYIQEDYEKLI